MKLPPAHFLAPAVCAAFAIAGWQAGGEKDTALQSGTAVEAPARKTKRSSPRTSGARDMPAEVRERLARIHAARTPEDRMRATIELAHSLPVSDLERWYVAEWFNFHDGMESNVFYRITRARWLAEDPAGLMAYSLRRNSEKTHEVAGQWAKQDPAAALAFLVSTKNDPNDFQRLVYAMAGPLAAADPALAIGQVPKFRAILGEHQGGPLTQMIGALAKHSPDLLKRESAAWPASLQNVVSNQLVVASLTSDFASGVASLRDAPDGKRRFIEAIQHNPEMLKEMAKHLAQVPPGWFVEVALENPYYVVNEDPEKWLKTDLSVLGFDDEKAKRLRGYALSYFASKNPDGALAMLAGGELDDDQRLGLLTNSFSNLASKDKARAEEWIARLSDPKEIEQARQAIENAALEAAGKTPPSPADWLAGLDGKDGNSMWQYSRVIRSWDRDQLAEAVREFDQLPADRKSAIAMKLVTSGGYGPPELRGVAIRQMLETPPPVEPNRGDSVQMTRQASGLVSEWGRKDPVAAGRWVNSLPAGEARLWAAKNLAAQWAEYEPSAARRWAAGLPADERQKVEAYLEDGTAGTP
jgi:hypothetical protein